MSAKTKTQFVVCIDNQGYEASLEVGKFYRLIQDNQAIEHGYLRIVDESGEDYAYAVQRFFPIDIPQALEDALTIAL